VFSFNNGLIGTKLDANHWQTSPQELHGVNKHHHW
jgi:hypothetical protein